MQRRHDLLATGLAGLDEPSRAHIVQELAYTANQLMVAQGASVGDPESVQQAWTGLRATISLALECLVRGQSNDEEQALSLTPEMLRNHTVQSLFRAGFNLSVPLQDLARRIQRDPRSGPERTTHWLSEDGQLMVQGLAQGQPVILTADHERVPLERLSEVQERALRLQQQLDVMVGVFDEPESAREVLQTPCESTNIADYQELDLIILQRTAELNYELTGQSRVQPIPVSALKILRKQLNKAHPMAQIVHDAEKNPRHVPLWLHLES